MLRERYEEDKFFMTIQTLASEMDPELAQIDRILDDDELFQMIKQDFAQRYPHTTCMGRPSSPVEVVLRMLVVRHLYHWSYEATEQHVKDSLVLRRFCRVYLEAVPDDTTLMRWANQIQPDTMLALNRRITTIATALKVTRGRKLRTDGTAVETNIHPPTDNSLLGDGVRVISRRLKRAQVLLGETLDKALFRDRTRSARRTARHISQQAQRGKAALKPCFRKLVAITHASLRQAHRVRAALENWPDAAADRVRAALDTFIPRMEQVIAQTVRRVFEDEAVPATDKIVSLFEAHTDIVKRSTAKQDVVFGHKVWLDEVDGGILSGYRVLDGNPGDSDQWQPSLDHHVAQFGQPPWQASADRGVYSLPNETYAETLGVKRVILPQPGAKSDARRAHERQRWFQRGRRWHAGVEGRISVVKRKHGLARCLDHGVAGFQRWVGWSVIANNLSVMGRTLAHA
jgi:IS5 family transposase